MKKITYLLLLFTTLSILSCSKTSAPLPELKDSQKLRLKSFMNDMGTVLKALESPIQKHSSKQKNILSFRSTLNTITNENSPFQKKVDEVLDGQDCSLKFTEGEDLHVGDGSEQSLPQFHLSITGKNCPLHCDLKIEGQQISESSIAAKFTMSYTANTADYQKESGFKTMNFSADIRAQIEQFPNGIKTKMSIHSVGGGDSLTEGTYNIDSTNQIQLQFSGFDSKPIFHFINPSPNELNFNGENNERVHVVFQDFKALLKKKETLSLFEPPKGEYSINDRSITAEEYLDYMKDIKIPGTGDENTGGDQPDPTPSDLHCRLFIHDARNISLQELQAAINQNTADQLAKIAVVSSEKGRSKTEELQIGPHQLKIDLVYFSDWAQANVYINEGKTYEDRLTLFANTHEVTHVADQRADLIFRYHCQP